MAKQTQGKADQLFFMECLQSLRPDKHYGRFVRAASTNTAEALHDLHLEGPSVRAVQKRKTRYSIKRSGSHYLGSDAPLYGAGHVVVSDDSATCVLQSRLGEVDLMREIHNCLHWHKYTGCPEGMGLIESLPYPGFLWKQTKIMVEIEEINP